MRSPASALSVVALAALSGCHPLGSLPLPDSGTVRPGLSLDVSPLSIDFGDVDAGSVADGTVTVQNLGTAAVALTLPGDPTGDSGFTLLDTSAATIPAGGSLDLTVRFAPEDNNPASAQLVIPEADATVTLTGTGRAPQLTAGEALIDPVVLGCSGVGTIPVWNAGSRELTITAVRSTTSVFVADSWPATLNPGETGTVEFTFTPLYGGTVEGELAFDTNEAGSASESVSVTALGYQGDTVAESFFFEPTDPTDIAFLIDGSAIGPYADRAAAGALAYVDALEAANVDFQLTAVSSGAPCPGVPTYAARSDTPARSSAVLSRAFTAGGGPADDDLLALGLSVLDESGASGCLAGFRRSNADLELVVVALGPSGADLDADLVALQDAAGASVRVSALVPTDGSCGTRADDYLAISAATAGVAADVCATDWTDGFTALASLPGGAGEVRYPLAQVPVPSSIVVTVGGLAQDGWLWESATNELVFDSGSFALGAEVDIRYVAAQECGA